MSNPPPRPGSPPPESPDDEGLAPTLLRVDSGEMPTQPGGAAAQAGSGPRAAPPAVHDEAFAARYALGKLLGEGGMGEVRTCRDQRIGRDVAIKVIRGELSQIESALARFEREAQVQGQLEHPSIVPVYDLGAGPQGAYFTMKRVRGRTLEEI